MPIKTPIDTGKVEYFVSLKRHLDSLAPGERKGPLISQAMNKYGCSRKTVYDWLRHYGGRPATRKRRSDAGDSGISEDGLLFVSRIVADSLRMNDKQTMPVSLAVEKAIATGRLAPDVTVENVRRLLRRRGLTPEILTRPSPHVQQRSNHPNHVWQFDVSTCLIYYMKGKLHELDPSQHYKNKPDNVVKTEKHRVQRYVVTDHTTGSIFCRYYLAPGESSAVLFEFFMEAFAKKPGFVMHGVPEILIWDKGSANTSAEIQNVLDALGVDHRTHKAGNPRAKGQAENAHNLVETQFESCMRFTEITRGIEQLNELVDIWQKDYNTTRVHRRHGNSRWELWQTIRSEQLRLAPDPDLCRVYMNGVPTTRKVQGDRTIRYAIRPGESYQYCLRHTEVCVGDRVRIIPNAFLYPDIVVEVTDLDENARHYQVPPIEFDQFGFPSTAVSIGEQYDRQSDTHIEHEQKARDEAMYGTSDKREAEKLKHSGIPAYGGMIDMYSYLADRSPPNFLDRPGTELHLPHQARIEVKPLNHIQALKYIFNELGRSLSKAENSAVKSRYPDGVPEEALPELVAEFRRRARDGSQSVAGGR